MKDRAGTVGAVGVSDLLAQVRVAAPDARIHLVGHSYGCKVILSALCGSDDAHAVAVDSVLLLQPATSCYCFAKAGSVPGIPGPGGYSRAPELSRRPVVCTYSRDDAPLTRFFHWAARRARDLGEVEIAGLPPSPYAALGGYGPQGVGATLLDAVDPPVAYAFPETSGIVGIRADGAIKDHGDVTSRATAWMLLNQVRE